MADLTVKYFNSGMTGAPQISNNWGDLVTMLDTLSSRSTRASLSTGRSPRTPARILRPLS